MRNFILEVYLKNALEGKSKVRGMSRIYLQDLEVKSLEVIYRQASELEVFHVRKRNASKRCWGCFHSRDRTATYKTRFEIALKITLKNLKKKTKSGCIPLRFWTASLFLCSLIYLFRI